MDRYSTTNSSDRFFERMYTPERVPVPVTMVPEPDFPELWGTYVTEDDERQMEQWRRETEEMLATTPASTRGQAALGGRNHSNRKNPSKDFTSSCSRKRPFEGYTSDHSRRRPCDYTSVYSRKRPFGDYTSDYGRKRPCGAFTSDYRPPSKVYINKNHANFRHLY